MLPIKLSRTKCPEAALSVKWQSSYEQQNDSDDANSNSATK
jgi:hypothetical protein